ncbi:transcriptional regulator, IclR family [Paracoccus halophilus]|uniref:IclR family transcriptional regulator n=1 Tax=Paracoccus halophilus TaxID=376733 RepID=A0A099F6U6_9RHOB|nr:IclR family transcriptional regulator [Paracoccus halophilus]KGJ05842.1 IclR family transcriptional regulator [Paracoccus halophilus]SFA40760.1 transcriptional regulator, IclR family [Paracoccus halophilus]
MTRPSQPSAVEAVDDTSRSYDVPPVTRDFSLLRYISEGNRCRNMSRAASALDINRTTLLRLLHTLERENMIERDEGDGGYRLSYGLLELASSMLSSRDVARLARPLLARLASDVGLSAHLGVLSGADVIVLVREAPEVRLVSNIREGSRLPAYATVMGRIILANMSTDEVHATLSAQKLTAITQHTAVTLEQLDEQLAADRAEGLAWSAGNYESGIGSCAAVVLDHSNRPVAAISVAGQQSTFEPESEARQLIADRLRGTAQQLSSLMGAQR